MITSIRRSWPGIAAAGAILAAATVSTPAMAQQPEQYFPVASMRVGPYNAMGTGIFGGVIDYLNYVNIKHGGVNGVKLVYEECETEYNAARNVECYQRLLTKDGQKMLLWDPYGTPLRLCGDRPRGRRQRGAGAGRLRPHRCRRRPRLAVGVRRAPPTTGRRSR